MTLDGHPEEIYFLEFLSPPTSTPTPTPARLDAAAPWPGEAASGAPAQDGGSSSSSSTAGAAAVACGAMASLCPDSLLLAGSSESLYLWDLRQLRMVQQADAPGTSGSNVPRGRPWRH